MTTRPTPDPEDTAALRSALYTLLAGGHDDAERVPAPMRTAVLAATRELAECKEGNDVLVRLSGTDPSLAADIEVVRERLRNRLDDSVRHRNIVAHGPEVDEVDRALRRWVEHAELSKSRRIPVSAYFYVWLRSVGEILRPRLPIVSPGWLTNVAVFLAGRKRSEVRNEWHSHLFGWPGCGLSRREQVRAAFGFLWSAVRFRLQDAADLGWKPIDAVLGSRTLSNLFVWLPVFVWMVIIVRLDGRTGLVVDDQDYLELAGGLFVAIKVGRWWRGVKPPEPKRHRPESNRP
jgi:hypothetical protein